MSTKKKNPSICEVGKQVLGHFLPSELHGEEKGSKEEAEPQAGWRQDFLDAVKRIYVNRYGETRYICKFDTPAGHTLEFDEHHTVKMMEAFGRMSTNAPDSDSGSDEESLAAWVQMHLTQIPGQTKKVTRYIISLHLGVGIEILPPVFL